MAKSRNKARRGEEEEEKKKKKDERPKGEFRERRVPTNSVEVNC